MLNASGPVKMKTIIIYRSNNQLKAKILNCYILSPTNENNEIRICKKNTRIATSYQYFWACLDESLIFTRINS